MIGYIKLISLHSDRQVRLAHIDLQLMVMAAEGCGWKPQPSQGQDAGDVLYNPKPDEDNDVSDRDALAFANVLKRLHGKPKSMEMAIRRTTALAEAGAFRLVVQSIRSQAKG